MSAIKGNRRVVLKNPLDPATWSAEETLRNASILLDENGNVIVLPVFQINPQANPNSINNLPTVRSLGLVGNGQPAFETEVGAQIEYLNRSGAAAWDIGEEATNLISARATGAASTQLLAAGGVGKQYKLYALSVQLSATAAVGQMTVNEVTSGTIIAGGDVGAAGSYSFKLDFGPNGVLQPGTNNAIQVTGVASGTINATLVYAAAR